MKYLKTINELFDSEDLKAKYEIPYLQGEFSPMNISKSGNLIGTLENPLLTNLTRNCPFLIELGWRKNGKILQLGYDGGGEFEDGGEVFYYFMMEITEFGPDKFNFNVYAKSIERGEVVYDKSLKKGSLTFIQLVNEIKRPALNILIDFDNWTEERYGEDNFSIDDKNISIFNPEMN